MSHLLNIDNEEKNSSQGNDEGGNDHPKLRMQDI